MQIKLLLAFVGIISTVIANIPQGYDDKHLYGDIHQNVQDDLKQARKEMYERVKIQAQNDKNLNGQSDFKEAPTPRGEEEEMLYWFALNDINGDGYLDGIEFRVAFTKHIPADADFRITDVEQMIDHIFDSDDVDNDGKISWEEYLATKHK
ncbi:hypothetical protein HK098_001196 [Nowakowskiella sp. JEL0407]|nr:hypothetical protein HK098_001196 [Nowakowskiella sp. JEL0407]